MHNSLILVVFVSIFALAACSGGGGSPGSPTISPPPPPSAPPPPPPPPPSNSAPVLTSPSAYAVEENSEFSVILSANDADGDPISISVAGDDASAFIFDPVSNRLEYALCGLNFESSQDADSDAIFDLVVRLNDGTDQSEVAISISIVDIVSEPSFGDGLALITPPGSEPAPGVAGSLGDINCDGYPDLFVAEGDGSDSRRVFVLSGFDLLGQAIDVARIDEVATATISSHGFFDPDYQSVGLVGDIDGDGVQDIGFVRIDDVVILSGSTLASAMSSGSDIDLNTAALGQDIFRLEIDRHDKVVSLGDLDGDGLSEFAIGQSNTGRPDYVVFSDIWGANILNDGVLSAAELGNRNEIVSLIQDESRSFIEEEALAAGGDLDGDGLNELLLGKPGVRSYLGKTYIVTASALLQAKTNGSDILLSELAAKGQGISINGTQGSTVTGQSLAGLGDLNGDNLGDIAIGAPNYDEFSVNTGLAIVISGADINSAIQSGTNLDWDGIRLSGNTSDLIGTSLFATKVMATAGDIDRDGKSELLVGAPFQRDSRRRRPGAAYLFFGDTLLTGASDNFDDAVMSGRANVLRATTVSCDGACVETFQYSINVGGRLGAAGDIDGDGFHDVLINTEPYRRLGSDIGNPDPQGPLYLISGRFIVAARAPNGSGQITLNEIGD